MVTRKEDEKTDNRSQLAVINRHNFIIAVCLLFVANNPYSEI